MAFLLFDTNGDGYLCCDELLAALRPELDARFPGVRDATARELAGLVLRAADADRDGRLSEPEFLRSYAAGPGVVCEESVRRTVAGLSRPLAAEEVDGLRRVFRETDTNGDGYIDSTELAAVLVPYIRQRHPSMPVGDHAALLHLIIATADKDGDGRLSFPEFARSFAEDQGVLPPEFLTPRGEPPPPAVCVYPAPSNRAGLSPQEVEFLRAAFRELDRDGNGFIECAELEAEIGKQIQPRILCGEEVQGIITSIIACVDKDADGRINVEEFLASFAEGNKAMCEAVVAVSERVCQNCAALEAVLDDDEISTIIGVFHKLDVNKDGYLDAAEIEANVTSLLVERMPDLADDPVRLQQVIFTIINSADVDADGRLSLGEFLLSFMEGRDVFPRDMLGRIAAMPVEDVNFVLSSMLSPDQMECLVAAFSELDRNDDGFLDHDEMFRALNGVLKSDPALAADAQMRALVIDQIIQSADLDHDGRLSLSEFVRSFQERRGVLPPEVVRAAAGRPAAALGAVFTAPELTQLAAAFAAIDTNGDGFLDANELQKALNPVFKQFRPDLARDPQLRALAIDLVIQSADTDHDGRLSLGEFVASFADSRGVVPLLPPLPQRPGAVAAQSPKVPPAPPSSPAAPRAGDRAPAAVVGGGGGGAASSPALGPQRPNPRTPERGAYQHATPQGSLTTPATRTTVRSSATPRTTGRCDPLPHPPRSPFANDVSGCLFTDAQLAAEWGRLDPAGTGSVPKEAFRRAYLSMEWCGLQPSQRELDRTFRRFAGADDRLSYDEFALLMLHRAKI